MTITRQATSRNFAVRSRTEEIDEQVGDDGEIVGGSTTPGHAGGDLRFTVRKRTYAPSTSQAILTFLEGAQALLTITVRINQGRQQTQFRAVGAGVNVDYRLDWVAVETTRRVGVSGMANGQALRGVLTLDGGDSTVNLALEQWLPDELEAKLAVFLPSLEAGVAYYRQQGLPDFSPDGVSARAWYNWVGRAACWGAAGLVTAASCVGSAPSLGLGCAAGAIAAGAGASVCSDWVSTL
jgi:hypothetical protein